MAKDKKAVAKVEAGQGMNVPQFSPEQVKELQELHRLASGFTYLGKQIQGNTALIPDGKKLGEQFEALGRLLTNNKQHWITQTLAAIGYKPEEQVSIDLNSGLIVPEKILQQAKKLANKPGKDK